MLKNLIKGPLVGTLDEHMHLLLPALIRLFKVDASVDVRRAAIKTLTRLIPRVQVDNCIICWIYDKFIKYHNPLFLIFSVVISSLGYGSHFSSCASLEAGFGWV